MGSLEIEVVSWAIQVRRHEADRGTSVLDAVRGRHLEPGDLRDPVCFIGRFQWASKQVLFSDGLRSQPWINA